MTEVFTLLLEVTKAPGDDLPEEASGAAFVIFVPAGDVDEAVREAVKIFREAGLSPIEVTNLGTKAEREAEGYEFSEGEIELLEEALSSNAVVILDKQIYYGEDDEGARN